MVSDSDYQEIQQFKWYVHKNGYAYRTDVVGGKPKCVYMHRKILGLNSGGYGDHINGNKLDNRRENLRICTSTENCANRKIQSNNKSGYKGVISRSGRWFARVQLNKKKVYGEYFDTKEAAAKAYDVAARRFFGEYAKLNFE